MCGDQFVQRAGEVGRRRIGRVEEGVLRRSPGGVIRREGCGEAARLPVSAAEQSFGKLHIMTPGDPQAGPQQGRVETRATRPHPAHRTGTLVLGNCCRKILNWNGIMQPAAVLGELAEQRGPASRNHRNPHGLRLSSMGLTLPCWLTMTSLGSSRDAAAFSQAWRWAGFVPLVLPASRGKG